MQNRGRLSVNLFLALFVLLLTSVVSVPRSVAADGSQSVPPNEPSPADGRDDQPQAQWFEAGPFTAILPGKPEKEDSVDLTLNRPIVSYKYTAGPNQVLQVGYMDLSFVKRSPLFSDNNRLFDILEVDAAKCRHGTLKDGPVQYKGKTARQAEITFSSTQSPQVPLVDKRIYLADENRIYWIGCSGPTDWCASPPVDQFMRSFGWGMNSEKAAVESRSEKFQWAALSRSVDLAAVQSGTENRLAGAGDSLLEPSFTLTSGRTVSAGRAWCTKLSNGRIVIVTALHLLGPDGGLSGQIQGSDVARAVQEVELTTCYTRRHGISNKVLSKTGEVLEMQSLGSLNFSDDYIILDGPKKIHGFPILVAHKPPEINERVWLYTKVVRDDQPRMYPAVVLAQSDDFLEAQLFQPLPLTGTSGSPILNKQGKVVGMINSAKPDEGLIFCTTAGAIAKHIRADVGVTCN
jgi:hypothetical protein